MKFIVKFVNSEKLYKFIFYEKGGIFINHSNNVTYLDPPTIHQKQESPLAKQPLQKKKD